MPQPDPLACLVLDYETLGLNDDDPIVEVGAALTTPNYPWDVIATFSAVVRPTRERWWEFVSPFVRNMHNESGLWPLITDGVDVREAEDGLLAVVSDVGPRESVLLMGSGVGHFDRRVMAKQMPALHGWLQHPNVDGGGIRRFLHRAGRGDLAFTPSVDRVKHRALPDALDHLEELRFYAELVRSLPKR